MIKHVVNKLYREVIFLCPYIQLVVIHAKYIILIDLNGTSLFFALETTIFPFFLVTH